MNNPQLRQEIIESLIELSDDQLLEIKELITQTLTPKIKTISQEERKQLIKSLQGKYAHAATSSEEFARRKQGEIDLEERNR